MARPPQYFTAMVEDFGCVLDLAWLRRQGARSPGARGRIAWTHDGIEQASIRYRLEVGYLRLSYGIVGSSTRVDECLAIVTTSTRFGGRRHWFSCPRCARRCRLVYGGERFLCRTCLGARYESQYQSRAMTITARRWRLRRRLEQRGGAPWPGGLDDGFPPKPSRMHWTTYHRLLQLDRKLEWQWNGWIRGWLHRVDSRLVQGDDFLRDLAHETALAPRETCRHGRREGRHQAQDPVRA